MPEMGEYLVGAYLKLIDACDVVDYGVRVPGGGMAGLHEIDVVGLRFRDHTAFLCEVTTHLEGLLYGKGWKDTVDRIRRKHQYQQQYAEKHLPSFKPRFMLWSPVVSKGVLTTGLAAIDGLELVVNEEVQAPRRLAPRKGEEGTAPDG